MSYISTAVNTTRDYAGYALNGLMTGLSFAVQQIGRLGKYSVSVVQTSYPVGIEFVKANPMTTTAVTVTTLGLLALAYMWNQPKKSPTDSLTRENS